jgi:hypothetical protein
MEKVMMNLVIFVIICFMVYIIFKFFNFREGMTDASGNTIDASGNGIAGNSSSYAASIKTAAIQLQDQLLVSKYRSNYETVILNLDDLVNNLMLTTALSVNPNNPQQALTTLNQLNDSKTALNHVMKFLDSQ